MEQSSTWSQEDYDNAKPAMPLIENPIEPTPDPDAGNEQVEGGSAGDMGGAEYDGETGTDHKPPCR